MKEELTTKMHNEFSVTKKEELQMKCWCVWDSPFMPENPKREDIEKICEMYGVSYEDAVRYKK